MSKHLISHACAAASCLCLLLVVASYLRNGFRNSIISDNITDRASWNHDRDRGCDCSIYHSLARTWSVMVCGGSDSSRTPPTMTQAIVVFTCLMLSLLQQLFRLAQRLLHKVVIHVPYYVRVLQDIYNHSVFRAALILSAVILYCFHTDRSRIFEHIPKVVDLPVFEVGVFCCLLLGLLTIRRTSNISSPKSTTYPNGETPWLPRAQTEEWKGWMQLVVLLYHYTGMSQVLRVYQFVRLLVGAYLFLTGYGHTVYFLKTENFGLRRLALVAVRINLLAGLLSLAMNTTWDFYYFPALSTFWTVVTYLTFLGHKKGKHGLHICLVRIIISASLLKVLLLKESTVKTIFGLLHQTHLLEVNDREFLFRANLDFYAPYTGMLFAVGQLRLHDLATDCNLGMRSIRFVTFGLSTLSLLVYCYIAQTFDNKLKYNEIHPVISIPPILSFIYLRNGHEKARAYHSAAFGLIGRCSLETFVLQYHIWLAADTREILRAGIFGSSILGLRLEQGFITALFLWSSRETAKAITVITKCLIEDENGPLGWVMHQLSALAQSAVRIGPS